MTFYLNVIFFVVFLLFDFDEKYSYNKNMENLFVNGFEIFGLEVKFYGIIIALGMLIAVFVAVYNTKYRGLKPDDIYTVALYALPLAILGARIYYVIFSPHSYTFLEFLDIRSGGMAIYGGVIGGALGLFLFCLIHKKNFLKLADVACVSLILGQAIGRWGNFFNQEAYGYEVTNKALQWFPYAVYIENNSAWHMATFFYESILNLCIFFFLMIMIRKLKNKGTIMSLYFICYGLVRVFVEGLRTDSLYLGNIRVSQLLSGILVVAGIILFILFTLKPWEKSKGQSRIE